MARSRQPTGGGEAAIRVIIGGAAEADGEGGTRDERLARKQRNDVGNAERLRARFGSDFFYVPEIGWYAWVKTHWSPRDGDRLSALACQKTAAKIWDEALAIEVLSETDKKTIAQLREWAVTSGNKSRLEAMRDVAAPHLTKHVDELDSDPLLFNVQNGTLELGDLDGDGNVPIRLRRHARRDMITRISPIGYDPDARCSAFDRFVEQVLPDPDVRRWVQKLFGYGLTGLAIEHMLAAFWGEGRNGKGTISKLFRWLYGDYGGTIEFASLLSDGVRRGGEATPDLAKLTGKRAVFAGEPRKGAKIDDGKVKQITGGDAMDVRFLNREFFELQPAFKLVLSFNHKPVITDESHAMWSRIRLVPFTVIVPEDQQDKNLLDKLRDEGPGVLNWALDGYRLWREEGLDPPAAMVQAAGEYRAESDWLGEFLTAATTPDPSWLALSPKDRELTKARWSADWRLAASDLYDCYKGYAEAMERGRPISQTKFGRELTKRGFLSIKEGFAFRIGLRWSGNIDWKWGPWQTD